MDRNLGIQNDNNGFAITYYYYANLFSSPTIYDFITIHFTSTMRRCRSVWRGLLWPIASSHLHGYLLGVRTRTMNVLVSILPSGTIHYHPVDYHHLPLLCASHVTSPTNPYVEGEAKSTIDLMGNERLWQMEMVRDHSCIASFLPFSGAVLLRELQ